ncbi:hypothetical protein CPC08DRAFT_713698, partial [Agrocybe pediades]
MAERMRTRKWKETTTKKRIEIENNEKEKQDIDQINRLDVSQAQIIALSSHPNGMIMYQGR